MVLRTASSLDFFLAGETEDGASSSLFLLSPPSSTTSVFGLKKERMSEDEVDFFRRGSLHLAILKTRQTPMTFSEPFKVSRQILAPSVKNRYSHLSKIISALKDKKKI